MKYLYLMIVALLTACGQTESSVSAADVQEAAQTKAPTGQVLRVANEWAVIADGNYVILPTTDTQIDLLAENRPQGATLYAKRLPEKVEDIQSYFSRLQTLLNGDAGYLNPQSQLTENTVRYQFTRQNGDVQIQENCLLRIEAQTPYLACVYGSEPTAEFLTNQIHDIQIKQ